MKYKKSKCKYYCKKFDLEFMKPWFVHKYSQQEARRKDEFVKLFMNQGKELQKIFLKDDDDLFQHDA